MRNYAWLVQRHLDEEEESSVCQVQGIYRGNRGTCVGVLDIGVLGQT